MVGVVSAFGIQVGSQRTIEFEAGRTIQLPDSSRALFRRGIDTGDLLLFGEDFGRSWYAAMSLQERIPVEGCYWIAGAAYDEPDAVIMLAGQEWRGLGLRLPKSEDFETPEKFVDSEGLYWMGDEHPVGEFCVDTTGSVFSLPFP